MNVHVSRLTAADVPAYRALLLHAYDAAPDAFTSTAAERAREPESWWLRRVADPEGRSVSFGAFFEDELVGAVTLERSTRAKTKHKALVVGLFVRETFRGKGAGAALIDALLVEARTRPELCAIGLTVAEGNSVARRLDESRGFRPFGVEPMAIATPEGFRSKIHLWRELGN